ncbi:MAG: DNA mismatch repair endonuclease MutL [Christensenellaceae bacterium]|nr:DNA mismatch repair endonuclease MutL [Christensenellaceae bacterium]
MAGRIQLLSEEVIGKIAAGEVVERPSAAIKELVENSLDAGASAVTVEIRDGGISYFRVTDNGSGIRQSDIRMAFERHATSKITNAQDLFGIQTLGFRGEALASIAAVAHVTCTTRTKDDPSGIKVQNDGGQITAIEETACPEGTTFVVRDLFYNTPVRLKFLKKPATEAGFVSDLMMRLILSRPDVSFRYISQGKTLYHSSGDGKLDSAVFAIYGNEMLRTMRKVDGHQAGVLLRGYVGIGESGRGNRSHQSFFINGRYMRSSLLSSAVEAACRERVMIGKFPSCVLHLTMPYETVDVNVHPNKLEVRFQNEAAVVEAVEAIIRDAIADRDALEKPAQLRLTPEPPATPVKVTKQTVDVQKPESVLMNQNRPEIEEAPKIQAIPAAPIQEFLPDFSPISSKPTLRESAPVLSGFMRTVPLVPEPAAPPEPTRIRQIAAEKPHRIEKTEKSEQVASFLPEAQKPLRLIGVVFNTFILVEYDDNLLMIDQHAVHERLLFDRFMQAVDQHRCGQELLIPMIVSVTRREQALLSEHCELLESIGLTVEPFGDTEVSIRTIPMILGEPQTQDFLHEVMDQLENERGSITLEKRRASILQMACKKAVKGGDALSDAEIRDLVTRMVDDKVTPTCPHGRPLVVALSHHELDKRFKRIQ